MLLLSKVASPSTTITTIKTNTGEGNEIHKKELKIALTIRARNKLIPWLTLSIYKDLGQSN